MQMYHLIEYSDNYSGTTGSLWQYHKNEPKTSFKLKSRFLANTNQILILIK